MNYIKNSLITNNTYCCIHIDKLVHKNTCSTWYNPQGQLHTHLLYTQQLQKKDAFIIMDFCINKLSFYGTTHLWDICLKGHFVEKGTLLCLDERLDEHHNILKKHSPYGTKSIGYIQAL